MAQSEAAGLEYIGPCPATIDEAWVNISLPDGWTSRTKVVWPRQSKEQLLHCPLLMYFHGGGFAACSPDLVLAPARGIASILSCVVACPSSKQLPEHPFPAPVQSAWEVCVWLSDAKNLNNNVLKETGARVNLARGLVVGGLSAGATAAAVIAGIAGATSAEVREFAGLSPLQSPITGVFSGLPILVSEDTVPTRYRDILQSREENADNGGLTTAMVREFEDRLSGALHSPWFSPINLDLSSPKAIQHHPRRVFTYSCALDPLRDDAIIYQKWLSELPGVEARVSVVEGENHTAWVSPPWPASHSRTIKEITLDGMAWLLNLEWDKNQASLPV